MKKFRVVEEAIVRRVYEVEAEDGSVNFNDLIFSGDFDPIEVEDKQGDIVDIQEI